MKLFIDTANLSEIREAQSMRLLDGVTTNPTLMAREGLFTKEQQTKRYEDICKLINVGSVSAEVLSLDYESMIQEGKSLYSISPANIAVKIPATLDGLKAIAHLTQQGIPTNCTLIFAANQALLAAKSGATYVSPFIGRIDDMASNGLDLIADIKKIFVNYNFQTQILAASIRTPVHISECAKLGADVATIPFKVLSSLVAHPLTDMGLEAFSTALSGGHKK